MRAINEIIKLSRCFPTLPHRGFRKICGENAMNMDDLHSQNQRVRSTAVSGRTESRTRIVRLEVFSALVTLLAPSADRLVVCLLALGNMTVSAVALPRS